MGKRIMEREWNGSLLRVVDLGYAPMDRPLLLRSGEVVKLVELPEGTVSYDLFDPDHMEWEALTDRVTEEEIAGLILPDYIKDVAEFEAELVHVLCDTLTSKRRLQIICYRPEARPRVERLSRKARKLLGKRPG
jgi:hypothetical protein